MTTNKRRPRKKRQPENPSLKELRDSISGLSAVKRPLKPKVAKLIGDGVESAMSDLQSLRDKFDSVLVPRAMLDPTNPSLIGNFIGIALLAQPKVRLDEVEPFHGSGVYAIYYNGSFPSYKPLRHSEQPIYVGSSSPDDALATTARAQGKKLHRRLKEHVRSIGRTRNLQVRDFECRYLVVHTGWEASAEKFIIDMFHPIWNDDAGICHGIGKHGDRKKRSNGRSPWDTMHPGRHWAMDKKLKDQKTKPQILRDLKTHFREKPPLRNRKSIMNRFFADLRQWKPFSR